MQKATNSALKKIFILLYRMMIVIANSLLCFLHQLAVFEMHFLWVCDDCNSHHPKTMPLRAKAEACFLKLESVSLQLKWSTLPGIIDLDTYSQLQSVSFS